MHSDAKKVDHLSMVNAHSYTHITQHFCPGTGSKEYTALDCSCPAAPENNSKYNPIYFDNWFLSIECYATALWYTSGLEFLKKENNWTFRVGEWNGTYSCASCSVNFFGNNICITWLDDYYFLVIMLVMIHLVQTVL